MPTAFFRENVSAIQPSYVNKETDHECATLPKIRQEIMSPFTFAKCIFFLIARVTICQSPIFPLTLTPKFAIMKTIQERRNR